MTNTVVRGFLRMACPVQSCKHVQDFTETTYTTKHPKETLKVREAYLRTAHSVGLHRQAAS